MSKVITTEKGYVIKRTKDGVDEYAFEVMYLGRPYRSTDDPTHYVVNWTKDKNKAEFIAKPVFVPMDPYHEYEVIKVTRRVELK